MIEILVRVIFIYVRLYMQQSIRQRH